MEKCVNYLIEKTRTKIDCNGKYIFFADRKPSLIEKSLRFIFPKPIQRGRVFDIWFHKHRVYNDQGDRERHNFFVSQEEKGLLNSVDDRCVWQESLNKYGRGRVDTGYDSRISRDRRR